MVSIALSWTTVSMFCLFFSPSPSFHLSLQRSLRSRKVWCVPACWRGEGPEEEAQQGVGPTVAAGPQRARCWTAPWVGQALTTRTPRWMDWNARRSAPRWETSQKRVRTLQSRLHETLFYSFCSLRQFFILTHRLRTNLRHYFTVSVHCGSFSIWLTDSEQTYICAVMQPMKEWWNLKYETIRVKSNTVMLCLYLLGNFRNYIIKLKRRFYFMDDWHLFKAKLKCTSF